MSMSLLSDANIRLERALKHVQISEDASERLKFPKASLKVSIPVRMDDGALRVFEGYRVSVRRSIYRLEGQRVALRSTLRNSRNLSWSD